MHGQMKSANRRGALRREAYRERVWKSPRSSPTNNPKKRVIHEEEKSSPHGLQSPALPCPDSERVPDTSPKFSRGCLRWKLEAVATWVSSRKQGTASRQAQPAQVTEADGQRIATETGTFQSTGRVSRRMDASVQSVSARVSRYMQHAARCERKEQGRPAAGCAGGDGRTMHRP